MFLHAPYGKKVFDAEFEVGGGLAKSRPVSGGLWGGSWPLGISSDNAVTLYGVSCIKLDFYMDFYQHHINTLSFTLLLVYIAMLLSLEILPSRKKTPILFFKVS